MKQDYRQRIADRLLQRKLMGKGAVVVEGAKWCGKTTTAEQLARSVLYMSQTGQLERNRQLALVDPAALLAGDRPRLIDEWQVASQLWDGIRHEADHSRQLGLFILTGSSVPADMGQVVHTGTGRFGWLRMRPMSLWESGDSSGQVSLAELFSAPQRLSGNSPATLPDVAHYTCRGGWPLAVGMPPEVALDQAFDYVEAVKHRDIQAADGVNRDPTRTHRLLRSLARHQGAQASLATIRADLAANEGEDLHENTVADYISALKRTFVIEDAEAWNPNLRSRSAIRTADTRYFTDPSIATAALGIGPQDLMQDLNTFGLMFETLCVRDLRVYAQPLNGQVYHFRDRNGLECDAVVHLRDGRYGLVEVKLGGEHYIAEGAATLRKLAGKIDTERMREPSFMMVLTAMGGYAYRRPDGVYVVPVTCLKD